MTSTMLKEFCHKIPALKAAAERVEAKRQQGGRHALDKMMLSNDVPKRDILKKNSGIPPLFVEKTLHNYAPPNRSANAAFCRVKQYAAQIVDNIQSSRSLLLLGQMGTGKTHLACGIAEAAMNHHFSVYFCEMGRLLKRIKESWKTNDPYLEYCLLRTIHNADLFILDDVGVQYGTQAEKIIIHDVINDRYIHQKPMILTSNLPIRSAGLEKVVTLDDMIGERAVDRLCERGETVFFAWESYRRKSS